MTVLPGEISSAVRLESGWNAALNWTVMWPTVNVPPELGNGQCRDEGARSGRGRRGDRLALVVRWERLRAGDRADRAHDLEHLVRG